MSSVRIEAEGFNHARLFNNLSCAGIEVMRISSGEGRKFAFTVLKKDMRKTFAILDEMCYNYSAVSFSGGMARVRALLCRLGLIVGIIAFSLPLALSRGFVWKLEIDGNDVVPDKVIENVLGENGVSVGKKLSGFDPEKLSAAVRAIDGISLASVYRRGTTVAVEVFEGERESDKLVFSDTDILSGYDATVTRVVTREGTALVEVGQNVFAGTPLIGAYRAPLEGEEPIVCKASGIVYGRAAFTYSKTVATEVYERTPISVKRRTRLKLFGLTVGKKPACGKGFEIEETSRKLDAFLPIEVISSRVTEFSERKVTLPIEKLAQQAEDEFTLGFIEANSPSGYKSSRTVRELGGGLYRVNVFIEAEIVIGGV